MGESVPNQITSNTATRSLLFFLQCLECKQISNEVIRGSVPGTRDGSGTVHRQERPGCLGNREESNPKEESTQEGGGRQKEKRWSAVWRERERARGGIESQRQSENTLEPRERVIVRVSEWERASSASTLRRSSHSGARSLIHKTNAGRRRGNRERDQCSSGAPQRDVRRRLTANADPEREQQRAHPPQRHRCHRLPHPWVENRGLLPKGVPTDAAVPARGPQVSEGEGVPEERSAGRPAVVGLLALPQRPGVCAQEHVLWLLHWRQEQRDPAEGGKAFVSNLAKSLLSGYDKKVWITQLVSLA